MKMELFERMIFTEIVDFLHHLTSSYAPFDGNFPREGNRKRRSLPRNYQHNTYRVMCLFLDMKHTELKENFSCQRHILMYSAREDEKTENKIFRRITIAAFNFHFYIKTPCNSGMFLNVRIFEVKFMEQQSRYNWESLAHSSASSVHDRVLCDFMI